MHDPMALFTDYAMALFAIGFAVLLWRRHRMWSIAFFFTAAGAILGGTFHGLAPESVVLWKATVFSVGIASFFLLAGCDRTMAVAAIVKLVLYLSWMTIHDAFLFVIVDYGLTLLLIAAATVMRRSPAAPWVLASIGASIAGALVQQFRVSLHPQWFDFNDLYHVIQTVALWMLYRAGGLLASARTPAITTPEIVPPTTRPT